MHSQKVLELVKCLRVCSMATNSDFDEWISNNGLGQIKHLFVKHGVTNMDKFTLISTEMQCLMQDEELRGKANMIPKIMNILHNITSNVVTVVISEEEQQVIHSIKRYLQSLHETENELNKLKYEYSQSQQRMKNPKLQQIEETKTKINQTFDKLLNALNQRREALLNQVDNFEYDTNNDDEEEDDILSSCKQNIESLRLFLKEKEMRYNNLTSTNDDRKDRKDEILNMGQRISNEFDEQINILTQNMESIKLKIKDNNKVIKMDYIMNDSDYQQAIDDINKLGTITHKSESPDIEMKSDIDEEEIITMSSSEDNDTPIHHRSDNHLMTFGYLREYEVQYVFHMPFDVKSMCSDYCGYGLCCIITDYNLVSTALLDKCCKLNEDEKKDQDNHNTRSLETEYQSLMDLTFKPDEDHLIHTINEAQPQNINIIEALFTSIITKHKKCYQYINSKIPTSHREPTPIVIAAHNGYKDIVAILLKYGADPLQQNTTEFNLNALSCAALQGHTEVVRLIYEHLLNTQHPREIINVLNNGDSLHGWSPLHLSCISGHEDVVKYLIHTVRLDIFNKDFENRTALEHAWMNGHQGIVSWLSQLEWQYSRQ